MTLNSEGFITASCDRCLYDIVVSDPEGVPVKCPMCSIENYVSHMTTRPALVTDKPEGKDDRAKYPEAWDAVRAYRDAVDSLQPEISFAQALAIDNPYQFQVFQWTIDCFGYVIAFDRAERLHRFFEEAGELVQALGMSRMDAHLLVDYVWARPKGDPVQEVGGVMTTLAALSTAHYLNVKDAAELELERIQMKVEAIRHKQASKPEGALPEGSTAPDNAPPSLREAFRAGWYVNACKPADYAPGLTEQQGKDYLEGCEQADWIDYWASIQNT